MRVCCRWLLLLMIALAPGWAAAQPNWPAIKANATFHVADTAYATPTLQPLQVPGWEDGLYLTRDGRHLFSTYLPLDAFSWVTDLVQNPLCFNFRPYYRPPLLGIDTVTNIFGCANYMHSDIATAARPDTSQPFGAWTASNLQTPFSLEGGAVGVLQNPDTFDIFVFTRDGLGTQNTDLMVLRHVPVNPSTATAVPLFSTPGQEDNPHVERLDATTLLLLFDRDRVIYYSLSRDDGATWQPPTRITQTLNDQAPYDVQPHLWHDGTAWWAYFCADNAAGKRGIYKTRQRIANDWDSWGPKELVLEGDAIQGGSGTIFGVGEPSLTQWGDLSFVVIYGDPASADTTDVFDCDPWLLPRKHPIVTGLTAPASATPRLRLTPNPASRFIDITLAGTCPPTITVINSLGMIVKAVALPATGRLDVGDLPPGVYTVVANGQVRTRLVKQ